MAGKIYKCLNPTGIQMPAKQVPLAPRLDTIDGKTIHLNICGEPDITIPLQKKLEGDYPNVNWLIKKTYGIDPRRISEEEMKTTDAQDGILRAIGIKRDVIVGSYLTQAIFYAVLGIVFGGLIFGYGILPYFEHYPLDLALGQVSLAVRALTISSAVLGMLVAAILAGLIPVMNITRQRIIQAIWGN